MEESFDNISGIKKKSFLGGLITTHKSNDSGSDLEKKKISILSIPLFYRVEEDNFRKYSFLGYVFYRINLLNKFRKFISKYIRIESFDDIYVLAANSGESFLTLTYLLDCLLKRNNSQKPVILATRKYHVDLVRMICPDIPCVFVGRLRVRVLGTNFNFGSTNVNLLFDCQYFKQVETDIRNCPEKSHYFQSILKHLQVSDADLSMRKIVVSSSDKRTMLEKVSRIDLNIDNFVFLAPEAKSCEHCSDKFWNDLIRMFRQRGFDVFVNIADGGTNLDCSTNYKTCWLSFAESFALASFAKHIVSLRSGLTEFLIQTNVPMDILYTSFKNRAFYNKISCACIMKGFGVDKIPFVDMSKIREFNMEECSEDDCIASIIENYLE